MVLIILSTMTIFVAEARGMPQDSPYGRPIRQIRIQGLHMIREEIVRAQLSSRVGYCYTEEMARDDYRGLDRLRVFSAIKVNATFVDDGIELTIEVREMPRIFPFPSINATSENGLSVGVGTKVPSLLRRAIALSASSRFGPLTEVEMLLQSPWQRKPSVWYDARYDFRDRTNELEHFQENAREIEFRAGSTLPHNWRVGGRFYFISIGSDKPGITLSPDNHDYTPALGALLEYDGRNLSTNPHRGWQTIFDVTQNGGFLGGDGSFATAQFDIRRYQPLAPRHFLALSSFATLQSGIVGLDVPLYRNYHVGGANTVRGWKGAARQGNNQFINTVEYRYELLSPRSFRVHGLGFYAGLQLAAFGDFGTAWDHGEDFNRNMIGGGGFGVRLIIPYVDMIRIDFGFGESGAGLVRNIGIREKDYYSRQRVR